MNLLNSRFATLVSLGAFVVAIVISLTGCALLETWLAPGSPEQVPITEEEADLLLSLQDSAAVMCEDLWAQEDPEFANKAADWLRQESDVSSVHVSEDNTVWIQYSCGLVGAVFSPSTRSRLDIDSALPQEREFSAKSTLSNDKPQVLPLATVPTSKRALFLIFNTVRKPSEELRQTFEVAGYTTETCIGSAFTLQKLRSLGEYGVIYFNTHGGAGDLAQLTGGRLSKTFWIATGEKTTGGKLSEIWSAFTPGVGIVNIPGEQGTYIMFNQRFVDDIALDNALVINHACSSLKYDSMANAFLNSGAAVYIGWTNTTFSELAAPVTLGLLHSLKQPNVTFSEAWNAKAITFPEWSESYSIGELSPMTVLNDADKDGEYCIHFRNGKIIGDDDDSGDDYVSDVDYRIRSGIDEFVLSRELPGSNPIDQIGFEVVWEKMMPATPSIDLNAAIKGSNEGAVIVGSDLRSTYDESLMVFEVTDSGDLLWQNEIHQYDAERGRAICPALDGGYLIAAQCFSASESPDGFVIKTDSAGNEEWRMELNKEEMRSAQGVQATEDGGIVVAGMKSGGGYAIPYILKLGTSREIEWQRTLAVGGSQWIDKLIRSSSGDLITLLIGDALMVGRFSPDGVTRWLKPLQGQGALIGDSIMEAANGDILVAGHQVGVVSDLLIWRLSAAGKMLWQTQIGLADVNELCGHLAETETGSILVAGMSSGGTSLLDAFNRIVVWGLDADGNFLGESTVAEGDYYAEPRSIVATADGFIICGVLGLAGTMDGYYCKIRQSAP